MANFAAVPTRLHNRRACRCWRGGAGAAASRVAVCSPLSLSGSLFVWGVVSRAVCLCLRVRFRKQALVQAHVQAHVQAYVQAHVQVLTSSAGVHACCCSHAHARANARTRTGRRVAAGNGSPVTRQLPPVPTSDSRSPPRYSASRAHRERRRGRRRRRRRRQVRTGKDARSSLEGGAVVGQRRPPHCSRLPRRRCPGPAFVCMCMCLWLCLCLRVCVSVCVRVLPVVCWISM